MNKINLRITLDNDEPTEPASDIYEYDYKRIAMAVFILLLISVGLTAWLLPDKDGGENSPTLTTPKEQIHTPFVSFESEEGFVNTSKPTTNNTKLADEVAIKNHKTETQKTEGKTSETIMANVKTSPSSTTNETTDNITNEKNIELEAIDRGTKILDPRITRAELTWEVNNLEPGEAAEKTIQLTKGDAAKKIIFYTELKEMTGQHFFYEWKKNEERIAKIKVNIGGQRWRSYSSKNLRPSMTGDWQVDATDADGNMLASTSFTVTAE